MLIAFTSICTFSFSQKNYQDVVYLKNGGILQGTVIYQVPTKSLKIETVDGNVFFFQLDEVEEIAKAPYEHKTQKDSIPRTSNGFVGISLGASIPIGDFILTEDFSTKTGIQINLINFGYLFSKNFGITVAAFGSLNRIDSDLHNINPWVFGSLMAGPLLSFPLSEKVEWDLRPMIGYSITYLPEFDGYWEEETGFSLSYGVGNITRYNIGEYISLSLSVDFYSSKPKFLNLNYTQKITTISFGFGIAYRL